MRTSFAVLLTATCLQFGATHAIAQEVKLPKQIVMVSDRAGGVSHTMGNGFAAVMSKYVGTRATVVPAGDPAKWIPMMRSGEADLGINSMVSISQVYWSTGPRKGKKPERGAAIIALGAPAHWGFLVPESSGVKTLSDLKKWMPGKRLTYGWINPNIDHLTNAYLHNLGYTGMKDAGLKAVPVSSYRVFVSLWNEQRVDMVGMPAGIPLVQQMFVARKGRFLPVYDTPAAKARLRAFEPAYYVSTQRKRKGLLGVEKTMPMLTYDYALAASVKLSNGVVKKILQTLWDHQKELAQIHRSLKRWLPANKLWASKNATVPYHPGAIEFYKSKGLWTPALEKLQAELVAKSKR